MWELWTKKFTNNTFDTLNLALKVSDCDLVYEFNKPRPLKDNRSNYVSEELGGTRTWNTVAASHITHKIKANQALSPDREEPHIARVLLTAGDLKDQIEAFFDPYSDQR